jgi:type IV pilus assembly protein PilA
MRRLLHAAGFSLIELMIVLSIIGILAVIAIPSYKTYTERARFAEVIAATAPFKTAISIALQQGAELSELSDGNNGIPGKLKATKNIASLHVENGEITAIGTKLVDNSSYILKPTGDGSAWTVSGSCIKNGLCNA